MAQANHKPLGNFRVVTFPMPDVWGKLIILTETSQQRFTDYTVRVRTNGIFGVLIIGEYSRTEAFKIYALANKTSVQEWSSLVIPVIATEFGEKFIPDEEGVPPNHREKTNLIFCLFFIGWDLKIESHGKRNKLDTRLCSTCNIL